MPPPVPYTTLNFNEDFGIYPSKIGTPSPSRLKTELLYKLRPTCGIPQTGKAFF